MGLRPMTRPIYGRNLDAVSNRRGVPRPKTDWNGSCAIWSAIGNSILLPRRKPSPMTGLPPITNTTKRIDQAVKYTSCEGAWPKELPNVKQAR